MCGLAGIIEPADNGLTNQNLNAFKFNLFLNSFRGADSTGVVGINKAGNAGTIKELGSSPMLMENNPKWDSFEEKIFKEGKIVFGHGRQATKGDISLTNAHPFIIDNGKKGKDRHYIILAHNGTLHANQQLPDFHTFDVDSAWLAQKIFDLGPEEALSKVNGAVATIWWDSKEKALFVFRNSERPLHFVNTKTGGTVHINSEGSVLMYLKYKMNLGFDWEDVQQFAADTLYRFDIKDPTKFSVKPIRHVYAEFIAPWETRNRRNSPANFVSQRELERLGQPNSVRYFPRQGTMENEVLQVWQENIKQITFIGGKKIISYKNRGSTEENCVPYEENLASISKVTDNKAEYLKFSYIDDKAVHTSKLVARHEWYAKVSALAKERQAAAASSVNITLLPGCKSHFHTRLPPENKEVIRHEILGENRINPRIAVYSNDKDGSFIVGQKILMEVYGTNEKPDGVLTSETQYQGRNKYEGMLYQPDVSPEVVIYFHTTSWTKEEVYKHNYFSGDIMLIHTMTNGEHNESGGHIKMYITNIRPADLMTESEREIVVRARNRTFEEAVAEYKKTQGSIMRVSRYPDYDNDEA